jgi:putative transposase
MPRPLRPIEEGLIYHVINRGNNRQKVFRKQADFAAFLKALGDLKERKPFELFGYCLLDNHFHLLIRPQQGTTISRRRKRVRTVCLTGGLRSANQLACLDHCDQSKRV